MENIFVFVNHGCRPHVGFVVKLRKCMSASENQSGKKVTLTQI